MINLYSATRQKSLAERETVFADSLEYRNKQGVILQTCNRVEFYSGEGDVPEDITRHLFRVVAGLESCLIGEIAIQGQVKTAYIEAAGKYKLSKGLHALFQNALCVGKRVRTESGISRGAISHSQAAVDIICKSNLNLYHALITIVGAHKLNEDIIRYLQSKGAETIFMANKSFEKAQAVAHKYNCNVFRLDQVKEFLKFTDILITATSAPHLIVKDSDFPEGKEMLIIDLAFPRDVDENIGKRKGVTLYNLENIEQRVNQNIDLRKNEIAKAEQIIEEEIERFYEKQRKDIAYSQIY
jgi:glutamyl-tRNA reductase